MATTTTATVTYRKTRDGQWVAFGPARAIKPGQQVTITKRSGETKQEWIDDVSKPFTVDGVRMVYGYLADVVDGLLIPRAETSARPAAATRQGRGGICDECGQPRRNLVECSDSSGLVGRCCPACASQPASHRSFA